MSLDHSLEWQLCRIQELRYLNPEYRFLPGGFRLRTSILQPSTMIVQQPEVPSPVMVTFSFPAWATRKDEVTSKFSSLEDVVREAKDWLA